MNKDKVNKFLIRKKATAAEINVYDIALGFKLPFKNGDILETYGTSRYNIRKLLENMIAKGLIIRQSYHTYLVKKG